MKVSLGELKDLEKCWVSGETLKRKLLQLYCFKSSITLAFTFLNTWCFPLPQGLCTCCSSHLDNSPPHLTFLPSLGKPSSTRLGQVLLHMLSQFHVLLLHRLWTQFIITHVCCKLITITSANNFWALSPCAKCCTSHSVSKIKLWGDWATTRSMSGTPVNCRWQEGRFSVCFALP